jgi:hypothetical protein
MPGTYVPGITLAEYLTRWFPGDGEAVGPGVGAGPARVSSWGLLARWGSRPGRAKARPGTGLS